MHLHREYSLRILSGVRIKVVHADQRRARLASVLSDRKSPMARQVPAGLVLFLFSFNFQQVLALGPFLN